jgi:hypothetical protein
MRKILLVIVGLSTAFAVSKAADPVTSRHSGLHRNGAVVVPKSGRIAPVIPIPRDKRIAPVIPIPHGKRIAPVIPIPRGTRIA